LPFRVQRFCSLAGAVPGELQCSSSLKNLAANYLSPPRKLSRRNMRGKALSISYFSIPRFPRNSEGNSCPISSDPTFPFFIRSPWRTAAGGCPPCDGDRIATAHRLFAGMSFRWNWSACSIPSRTGFSLSVLILGAQTPNRSANAKPDRLKPVLLTAGSARPGCSEPCPGRSTIPRRWE
jgi:hypothetical protein